MESVTSVRFYAESFEVGVNETKGNGCVDNTVEVFHAERFFKRKQLIPVYLMHLNSRRQYTANVHLTEIG